MDAFSPSRTRILVVRQKDTPGGRARPLHHDPAGGNGHRDSIYGAQGMRWRAGLGNDVPALTVARICGSGAEAVAVGTEMILAGVRHDEARPFLVAGGAESMQYPFCLYGHRGRMGSAIALEHPLGATGAVLTLTCA